MNYTNKYRPEMLNDVVGHQHVKKSIDDVLKSKDIPQSWLFYGPPGVGKTTLARIVAQHLHCEKPPNLIEIDSATYTGIDKIRELQNQLKYPALGESKNKFVIFNEFHRTSKQGMDSLLTILEEPSEYVYFAITTTDISKVPKTISSRCIHYNLSYVSHTDLFGLLSFVREDQKLFLSDEVLHEVIMTSEGSPRQALNNLQKCSSCVSSEEVKILLEKEDARESSVFDLVNTLLLDDADWDHVIKIVKSLNDPPETIRIIILNILSKKLLNEHYYEAPSILKLMNYFEKPFTNSGLADLLLAIGNYFYSIGEEESCR